MFIRHRNRRSEVKTNKVKPCKPCDGTGKAMVMDLMGTNKMKLRRCQRCNGTGGGNDNASK